MDFAEINHLLTLARLEIHQEEKEKIINDLAKILDYVNQLQEIDTTDIEPMNGGTFFDNAIREDEIQYPKLNLETELKNSAPKLKDNYFKVPPIF